MVVDSFVNKVSRLNGEVVLAEADGKEVSGLGSLRLINGEASTRVTSTVAQPIQIKVRRS